MATEPREEHVDEGSSSSEEMTMSHADVRLFLIRRTLMEMLSDRGYLVDEEEINMSKEEFRARFGRDVLRPSLDFVKERKDDANDQIHVFFPASEKVGVGVMKYYAEYMKDHNVKTAIIVLQKKLTQFAKECIQEISSVYSVETFEESDLLVNISKNSMVPQHIVLTDDEKEALQNQYNIKTKQLPRMSRNDPVAKYYGMKKGQVIKILRPGLPGEGVARQYRIVE